MPAASSKDKVCIIPAVLWVVLQIFGLVPVSIRNLSENIPDPKLSRGLLFISLGIFTFKVASGMTAICSLLAFNLVNIVNLEFFALLKLIALSVIYCQVPVLIVLVAGKSSRLPHLTRRIGLLLSERDRDNVRKASQIACVWIAVVFCGALAKTYHTTTLFSESEQYRNRSWFATETLAFGTITMPRWILLFWESASLTLGAVCDSTTGVLSFTLILGVGKAFRFEHNRLCRLCDFTSEKTVIEELGHSYTHIKKCLVMLAEFNNMFSAMVLLQCTRDLITVINFIATMLERMTQEPSEDLISYEIRCVNQKIDSWNHIFFAAIAVVNSLPRWIVCSYCHEHGQGIREAADQVAVAHPGEEIQKICERVRNHIQPQDTCVSVGGFAVVTKEFVASLAGILFTYTILVYQARDSKEDLDMLKSDVTNLLHEVHNSSQTPT